MLRNGAIGSERNELEVLPPAAPTFDLSRCYGVIGEYVRLWEPHTEASPVAIYACALAACGAMIGRGPRWRFGNAEHHARSFVMAIGHTSVGRKGTSINIGAKDLVSLLDDDFRRTRVATGLSSAEGLIAEVRDGTPEQTRGNKAIPADPGVTDKRLLVVETELGGTFETMAREGNRLSAVIRDLWDGVDVRTMVKHDPQRASEPHVVIVGAITPDELRKLLTKTSVANGLANRFLPVWAGRSRSLPDDSEPDPPALHKVVQTIRSRLADARMIQRVSWHEDASARWREIYEDIAFPEEASATLSALLARGAPYVRRMAMLLALLDGQSIVELAHLEASLSLWRYAADTWRFVYHDTSSRSDLAEKILQGLREAGAAGLTKTEIRETIVHSNATSADTINAALQELVRDHLAVRRDDPSRGGRRPERWVHVRHTVGNNSEATGEKGEKGEGQHFTPISPIPPAPFMQNAGPGLAEYQWPEEAA